MRSYATTQRAIRDLLEHEGPMTSLEISLMLGISYHRIRGSISDGRKESVRRFYVAGWGDPLPGIYKRPALYANGNRKDEPYPHIGKHQAYARRWQRTKMKRQIQAVGTDNPFASLIAQVTK